LVRRYEAGESIRQLAAFLGKPHGTIQQRLQAEGAQIRACGRPPTNGYPQSSRVRK
jgi:hypothetical protein